MTGKLDGKVALVSGSGRGIGRSIALKLASEGARLVINDLDQEPADETIALIRELGGQAVACVGNVTHTDFAERFVGTAVQEFKGLDIIINNAGYTWDNVIQKMTDEQWYAILDCHLTAPFRILRAAQPVIKALSKAELEAGQRIMRKVAILAFGSLLYPALQAAESLDATVANMRWAKPLDEALLLQIAAEHELIVTVEDGCIMGGAGSAVLESLAAHGLSKPVLQLGLPDEFIEHGDPVKLMALQGLDAAGIEASIRKRLER